MSYSQLGIATYTVYLLHRTRRAISHHFAPFLRTTPYTSYRNAPYHIASHSKHIAALYRTAPYRTLLHRVVPPHNKYRTASLLTVAALYQSVRHRSYGSVSPAPFRNVPHQPYMYRISPYHTYRSVSDRTIAYRAYRTVCRFFFSFLKLNILEVRCFKTK